MVNMRAECERILKAASEQNVLLRVIGGMAVHLHCPTASRLPFLAREYGDLDFVTASPDDQRMRAFFESVGFAANTRFNALQGAKRMIYDSQDSEWHIDIFINQFHMCHDIKFNHDRLEQDPVTIPLAELLLTKLQIVSINPKDVKDIAAMLIEHPLGETDLETINLRRILEITGQDWGFYTTVTANLQKIPHFLEVLAAPEPETTVICGKLAEMGKRMAAAPKTTAWKLRSLVGKSMAWYEEPEDAAREEMKLE
ncbi:MAG TPA: hypothetical protein VGJ97_09600 [Anaerolineaceae bacterium]|jgi:hypothetical protein